MSLLIDCSWDFYVDYGGLTQVYPNNWNECSLTDSKFGDEVFYRRNFEGELTFGGRGNIADYNLFRGVETDNNQCDELPFYIYKDSVLYWTGYFSTSQGSWDYDSCTFKVTPMIDDVYRKLLDQYDVEIDLLLSGETVRTAICSDGVTTYNYPHNYLITDLLTHLLSVCVPALTLHSSFLSDANNPITATTNRYRYLMIGPKASYKTIALVTEPVMLSLKGLLEMLRCLNLRWELNGTVLTVEHVSEWNGSAGIDVRTNEMALGANKYKYVKEEMPKYEKFAWMEAGHDNFSGRPIWYDSACVNQDPQTNILETSYPVTTDLKYIQESMLLEETYSMISDDGWVITANELRGASYYVWWNDDYIYGAEVFANADMGWAWLHNNFFRDDRQLITGYLNGVPTTFYSARKVKEQQPFSIRYESELDPEEYITTELGETYFASEKGFVQKAAMHPYGQIDLTLRYGPAPNANPGVTYDKVIQIIDVCDVAGVHSDYYAVANMATNVQVDIVFNITVRDAGGNDCTSANQTLTILIGEYYGTVAVAWPNACVAPWVGPPICVINFTKVSVTAGWSAYDPDYDCQC